MIDDNPGDIKALIAISHFFQNPAIRSKIKRTAADRLPLNAHGQCAFARYFISLIILYVQTFKFKLLISLFVFLCNLHYQIIVNVPGL